MMTISLTEDERALLRSREHPPTTDRSQLAKLLQPFWNSALLLVPARAAPNTLTVLGSLAVVGPTSLALWLSPELTTPLPGWLLCLQIVGVFAFQTLDALDGKQARRAGASSPLGSWLDHALDIITMQFVLLGGCASVQAGLGVATWALLAGTLFNNYLLHWESSHTRAFILGNGTSITEAQAMVIASHATALAAPTLFPTSLVTLAPPLAALPFSASPLSSWLLVLSVLTVGGAGAAASILRALRTSVPRAESARRLVCILLVLGPASAAWFSVAEGPERLFLGCATWLVASRSIARLVLENLLRRAPATLDGPSLVVVVCSALVVLLPSLATSIGALGLLGAAAALSSYFVITARGLASALGERIFSLERAPHP